MIKTSKLKMPAIILAVVMLFTMMTGCGGSDYIMTMKSIVFYPDECPDITVGDVMNKYLESQSWKSETANGSHYVTVSGRVKDLGSDVSFTMKLTDDSDDSTQVHYKLDTAVVNGEEAPSVLAADMLLFRFFVAYRDGYDSLSDLTNAANGDTGSDFSDTGSAELSEGADFEWVKRPTDGEPTEYGFPTITGEIRNISGRTYHAYVYFDLFDNNGNLVETVDTAKFLLENGQTWEFSLIISDDTVTGWKFSHLQGITEASMNSSTPESTSTAATTTAATTTTATTAQESTDPVEVSGGYSAYFVQNDSMVSSAPDDGIPAITLNPDGTFVFTVNNYSYIADYYGMYEVTYLQFSTVFTCYVKTTQSGSAASQEMQDKPFYLYCYPADGYASFRYEQDNTSLTYGMSRDESTFAIVSFSDSSSAIVETPTYDNANMTYLVRDYSEEMFEPEAKTYISLYDDGRFIFGSSNYYEVTDFYGTWEKGRGPAGTIVYVCTIKTDENNKPVNKDAEFTVTFLESQPDTARFALNCDFDYDIFGNIFGNSDGSCPFKVVS